MSFFTLVFRPGLREIMSSLLRLEHQRKRFLKFPISLCFLLIWNWKDKYPFIQSRSSLENHTRFQTKMDKVYTRFQTKTDPTLWGGTYLYGTYIPPGLNLGRTYFRAIKIARSLNENMRTIYTWFESALWASDIAFKAADERLLARSVRHCWKQEWLSRRLFRPNFIRVRARSNKVSSAYGLIAHSFCIKHTVEIYKLHICDSY